MTPASLPVERALLRARALSFALIGLLLGAFVLWHSVRFSGPTALLICTLAVAPWLLMARGLWRASPDACLGAMLLTTPYMGYALMEIIANPGARRYAAATAFLSLALAVALVANLRISRRRAAARNARTAP